MCSPVEHYVCFYSISFFKSVFFGVVPSKNGNRCPRKSGLSLLYDCLLCLPLCRACCLLFRLKLSWMATLLGKSLLFCSSCVLSEKVLCFMKFLSHPVSNCIDSLSLYSYVSVMIIH